MSVRGAAVKTFNPAKRGRSAATRLDGGEHTRTLCLDGAVRDPNILGSTEVQNRSQTRDRQHRLRLDVGREVPVGQCVARPAALLDGIDLARAAGAGVEAGVVNLPVVVSRGHPRPVASNPVGRHQRREFVWARVRAPRPPP